jgi:putative transposase
MKNSNICAGYRYPVWFYHRFMLSFRDIEELLAARGVVVSYETIRQWCKKYGSIYCKSAAVRFFKRLLKGLGGCSRRL